MLICWVLAYVVVATAVTPSSESASGQTFQAMKDMGKSLKRRHESNVARPRR